MILFSVSFQTAAVPLRLEIRSQRHYGPKLLRKCMWGTGTLTPKNQREQERPSQKGKSSNIYLAKTVSSRGCHDMSWRKLGRPAWINIFFSTCQFVRGKARGKGISCLVCIILIASHWGCLSGFLPHLPYETDNGLRSHETQCPPSALGHE